MFTSTKGAYSDKARLINLLAAYGIREPILSAFEQIPREFFVPRRFLESAYEDRALPIGRGQTISQPSLVAFMLQSLRLRGNEKVLEIGTGSGFQAALLGSLAKSAYSIERIAPLAKKAGGRIKKLGLANVFIKEGDGSRGLPKEAPFDAIIVSAAFKTVPKPLIKQLKDGGKLIMPVGEMSSQEAVLYEKSGRKLEKLQNLGAVLFVPLLGKFGWEEK